MIDLAYNVPIPIYAIKLSLHVSCMGRGIKTVLETVLERDGMTSA